MAKRKVKGCLKTKVRKSFMKADGKMAKNMARVTMNKKITFSKAILWTM